MLENTDHGNSEYANFLRSMYDRVLDTLLHHSKLNLTYSH